MKNQTDYRQYITESKINELFESSMNRLASWMKTHDIAMITAFRNLLFNIQDPDKTLMTLPTGQEVETGYEFSHEENRQRNKLLARMLRDKGLGFTKVMGSYMEDGTSTVNNEESYFVVNLNMSTKNFVDYIISLGEYFNQDSVLIKEAGKDAILIGTNSSEWPGYHEQILAGELHFMASQYMSRIKNAAFSFMNKGQYKVVNSVADLDNIPDIDQYSFLYRNQGTNFASRKSTREGVDDWISIVKNSGIDLESNTPNSWMGRWAAHLQTL